MESVSQRLVAVKQDPTFEMQELERLELDQLRRQELYKEFIEQASKLYIHALQNDKADISALMGLYAEVSRMRVLSSATVVDSADQIVKKIINEYLEPNKTFPELHRVDRPASQFQRGRQAGMHSVDIDQGVSFVASII